MSQNLLQRCASLISNSWRVPRATRSATAQIAPYLERSRSRFGELAADNWTDAYVVGFLTAAITVAAIRAVRALDEQALALVHLEAWTRLAPVSPDRIGEAILSFSLDNNAQFEAGCRDGAGFSRLALVKSGAADRSGISAPSDPTAQPGGDLDGELVDAWDRSIGPHLAGPAGGKPSMSEFF